MSILKIKDKSHKNKTEKLKQSVINPRSTKTFNMLINSDLHRDFKVKCAINQTTMNEVINNFITLYLKK